MDEIDVSIIVPIYNSERYLKKCLDSLVNQTFKKLEIILINDGSKDNSINIINEYATSYANIVAIEQENRGQGEARNQGIKKARGKYITFVDSDDWIEINLVEELYNSIIANKADISVCNVQKIEDNTQRLLKSDKIPYKKLNGKEAVSKLLLDKEVKSYPCGKLYKKEIFINNNIAFPSKMFYEDLAVLIQLFFFSEKIVFINSYGYYYLQTKNSSTRTRNKNNIWDRLKALKMIKDFLNHKGHSSYYNMEYNHLCLFHLHLLARQIYSWNLDVGYDIVISNILELIEERKLTYRLIKNTWLTQGQKLEIYLLKLSSNIYKIYIFIRYLPKLNID